MPERKPDDETWESFVERQIREAQERGEFDQLPGAGKEIPGLEQPLDELWWVKEKLKREKLSVLPEPLELRREVERALGAIDACASEQEVRSMLEALNQRIRRLNATVTSGPSTTLSSIDVEHHVRAWHARRSR